MRCYPVLHAVVLYISTEEPLPPIVPRAALSAWKSTEAQVGDAFAEIG